MVSLSSVQPDQPGPRSLPDLPIDTIFCIVHSVDIQRKPIQFAASSLADLKAFPETARSEAGHQLNRVQLGLQPADWKAMPSIGVGVYELRIRDIGGAFRVIYVAKMAAAIAVLHCFQKKTRKTGKADIAIASHRYRTLQP